MCSGIVVCLRLPLMRKCAAIRSPLRKISTVLAVIQTSTSGAGEAIGNAVIVRAGVDVIINADPTDAPFAEDIGLRPAETLSAWTVRSLLQQLPASLYAEASGWFVLRSDA